MRVVKKYVAVEDDGTEQQVGKKLQGGDETHPDASPIWAAFNSSTAAGRRAFALRFLRTITLDMVLKWKDQ